MHCLSSAHCPYLVDVIHLKRAPNCFALVLACSYSPRHYWPTDFVVLSNLRYNFHDKIPLENGKLNWTKSCPSTPKTGSWTLLFLLCLVQLWWDPYQVPAVDVCPCLCSLCPGHGHSHQVVYFAALGCICQRTPMRQFTMVQNETTVTSQCVFAAVTLFFKKRKNFCSKVTVKYHFSDCSSVTDAIVKSFYQPVS